VPIAEESGVIVPLGRWVLREACAQLARWRESLQRAETLTVSVNVSARQLQSGRFVQDVVDALEAAQLEPGGLVLEITEATVVHDPQGAADLLRTLRAMGVGLMLDDFGTGYSSLSVLDSLPFDGLKLDRSSVTRLEPSGGGVQLIRAIVDLGSALGLSLVAEGIEGEHQLAELKRLGVRHGQGFLFARPLTPGDLVELLRARSAAPRSVAA
jgi:EAL domain-containing protein (putative c-di-GMP-specific phosphodiesterase class I)